ncbi:hypothetical protein KIPB_003036 [Kipferlia bialata]|uniref:RRM domain-containing protein n=1 Tax=Kipferlia bialata TaxID=797122 RepID=A0A9K3CSB6_9EUKA|nr:hypothetical protein KIPB_003036 [Kipferlia bialata]|eukprot:g3036.t1
MDDMDQESEDVTMDDMDQLSMSLWNLLPNEGDEADDETRPDPVATLVIRAIANCPEPKGLVGLLDTVCVCMQGVRDVMRVHRDLRKFTALRLGPDHSPSENMRKGAAAKVAKHRVVKRGRQWVDEVSTVGPNGKGFPSKSHRTVEEAIAAEEEHQAKVEREGEAEAQGEGEREGESKEEGKREKATEYMAYINKIGQGCSKADLDEYLDDIEGFCYIRMPLKEPKAKEGERKGQQLADKKEEKKALKHRGFAYVGFETQAGLDKCLKRTGADLKGKKIQVRPSQPPKAQEGSGPQGRPAKRKPHKNAKPDPGQKIDKAAFAALMGL